jgi:hypothetical protein
MLKAILFFSILLCFITTSQAQTFTSNLPIVVLTTNGNTIYDEPKVMIDMGIIYNGIGQMNALTDPYNNYNGKIGIELRGNSTMYHPKKSWNIELWDAQGNDTNASIMGLPKEEDWILKASYLDKSFMRDIIPFKMWREMGYWAPNTQLCEVFVDGQYEGIYILYEKIKRDKNRVDIAKLDADDIAGDSLTGGYIVGLGGDDDEWMSNWPATTGEDLYYHLRYPKPGNYQPAQLNYIQNYIDSFEVAVNSSTFSDPYGNHYSHFIDVNSFIHHFFINDMSRNVDGLKQSTYLHKDKTSKGGKLMFSALWDYDVAYGNIDYCDSGIPTGWAYLYNSNCQGEWFADVPTWWVQLMSDTSYTNQLKCEWDRLRQTTFNLTNIFHDIDSIATYLDSAQVRNFNRWQVLGIDLEAFPGPVPTTYQGEVDYLKTWFTNRINWLDANMPGTCYTNTTGISTITTPTPPQVIPNPFSTKITLRFNSKAKRTVTIRTISGKVVNRFTIQSSEFQADATGWSSGLYIISVEDGESITHTKAIKQ